MTVVTQLSSYRPMGIALLLTTIAFMIAAFAAAYFRRWPLPTDPLAQLTLIADDQFGWLLQTYLFPTLFAATTALFGGLAAMQSGQWPRSLASGATVLFAAAFLLWLPISSDRLQLGVNAADMLRTFDSSAPPAVMANPSWVFWSHTFCVLGAIALMGLALASGGALPLLGWVVTGLAVAGVLVAAFVMRDWPPFMSYIIVLVLAIGLTRLQ